MPQCWKLVLCCNIVYFVIEIRIHACSSSFLRSFWFCSGAEVRLNPHPLLSQIVLNAMESTASTASKCILCGDGLPHGGTKTILEKIMYDIGCWGFFIIPSSLVVSLLVFCHCLVL